jgi:pimeloyl-ACP methyl ester carboxylesterase
VRVPTLLIYGERDRLVPVDDRIAQIEHALAIRVQPHAPSGPGEAFFWWHAAPA